MSKPRWRLQCLNHSAGCEECARNEAKTSNAYAKQKLKILSWVAYLDNFILFGVLKDVKYCIILWKANASNYHFQMYPYNNPWKRLIIFNVMQITDGKTKWLCHWITLWLISKNDIQIIFWLYSKEKIALSEFILHYIYRMNLEFPDIVVIIRDLLSKKRSGDQLHNNSLSNITKIITNSVRLIIRYRILFRKCFIQCHIFYSPPDMKCTVVFSTDLIFEQRYLKYFELTLSSGKNFRSSKHWLMC